MLQTNATAFVYNVFRSLKHSRKMKPTPEPIGTRNADTDGKKPSAWQQLLGELLLHIAFNLPFGLVGAGAYLAYTVGGLGLLLLLLPVWVGLFYALRRLYRQLPQRFRSKWFP